MDALTKAQNLLDEGNPSKALKLLPKGPQSAYLRGEALRMLGDFSGALKAYAAAKPADAVERINLLLGIAKCNRTLGNAELALDAAGKALAAAEAACEDDLQIEAKLETALALRAMGDLKESLALLNGLYKTFSSARDCAAIGYVQWARGGIYRLLGEFKLSISEFEKSVANAKKSGDEIMLGYAWFGLAGVSRVAGDVASSEKYYRLAEKIFRNTDDVFGKAYANCGLANALRQKGALDEALQHYVTADKLYSSIKDRPDLGFVKWGRGNILLKRGAVKQALAEFKKALALFDGSDEKRGELLSRLSIASTLYLLGNKAEADRIYDAAVAEARKHGLHTYLEQFT
jgi:tetratricopeptide (TPR) repeat protein